MEREREKQETENERKEGVKEFSRKIVRWARKVERAEERRGWRKRKKGKEKRKLQSKEKWGMGTENSGECRSRKSSGLHPWARLVAIPSFVPSSPIPSFSIF